MPPTVDIGEHAMRKMPFVAALAALAAANTNLGSEQHAQAADFYAGKRLTILINYAAGGPADVEGRVVAKHIGKHIPGHPTIIVQNMDGAGGRIATSYLGEIAPKDGSIMGLLTGVAWPYASDLKPRKVDFKTYEFVAYQPGTTVYFIRSDVKPGIKTPLDLGSAEGVVSGGLSAESSKDLLLRISLELLGRKYKYVTGYRGSAAARLAIQTGEINYYSESPPSYRGIVEPSLVKKGIVVGLFYDSGWDGSSYTKPRQVEGLDMLSYHELFKKIRGHEPSGQLWDTYKSIVALSGAMQRIAAFPPSTPKAAIEALRKGFEGLLDDKDFAAEGRKTFGFVPAFQTGPDTAEKIRNALTVKPETKAFIAKFVADARNLR
jgi:tripartite-type tricarboxylate transporter receptor subunit TctC